jgi:hypothetical protein
MLQLPYTLYVYEKITILTNRVEYCVNVPLWSLICRAVIIFVVLYEVTIIIFLGSVYSIASKVKLKVSLFL